MNTQTESESTSKEHVTQRAFPTAARHTDVDQVTEQGGTVLPQISWRLSNTNMILALPLENQITPIPWEFDRLSLGKSTVSFLPTKCCELNS